MYLDWVKLGDGTQIQVEILAHDFSWESYHSELNQAGHPFIPSRLFSRSLDLRGVPQSFDQRLTDNTRAAISLRAPAGFDGHLLYLREDLVQRYAAGRRLVWLVGRAEPVWVLVLTSGLARQGPARQLNDLAAAGRR